MLTNKIKKATLRVMLLTTLGMILAARPAVAVPVNTELLLLVDVSGSISNSEFNLQRTGYASAFQNAAVQNLIAINPGGIAVSVVYWSSSNQQTQAVGWTHLTNASSANAFATAISNAARPYSSNTAVQSALSYGGGLFANNGFEGVNLIIDVSGDGVDNNSPGGTAFRQGGGRASALAAGIDTINGLVIGGAPAVTTYYNNYVLGGGGVLFAASTFNDFASAVQEKIFYEVGGCVDDLGCGTSGSSTTGSTSETSTGTSTTTGTGSTGTDTSGTSTGNSSGGDPQVPEPATLLLMLSGLSGMAFINRRGRSPRS